MSIPPLPFPVSYFEGDFDAWVRHVFDHPVLQRKGRWGALSENYSPRSDSRAPDDLTCVRYLARLFRNPVESLAAYDDPQIAEGLQCLVGQGMDHGWAMVWGSAPLAERLAAINAIEDLFERLFVPRCREALAWRKEIEGLPLNGVCYMWWDVFPTGGSPDKPEQAEIDAAILGIMRRLLKTDHLAIQESMLHGLGHWHMTYPEAVQQTIDEFLARPRDIPIRPELVEYAEDAREGEVL